MRRIENRAAQFRERPRRVQEGLQIGHARFPGDEKFVLTSQIRRSSRSVCLNLREAWAKRRYQAHFVSKLTDCDGENSETDSSLDFARDCGYLTDEQHCELIGMCAEIGKMLGSMINRPGPFLISDV